VAKAASWTDTDAEVRKRGEQTGLDIRIVGNTISISGLIEMQRKKNLTMLKTSFIQFALWVTPISISGLIEMKKKA
jgi:hypothetical protein